MHANVLTGTSYRVAVKPPHVDFDTAHAAAQKSSHQGATLQQLLHNKQNTNMLQVRVGGVRHCVSVCTCNKKTV